MQQLIGESLDYLGAQTGATLLALFWYVAVFEVPRYTFSFAIAAFFGARPGEEGAAQADGHRVSVVVAGHNEADSIELCVQALREQSRPADEIILVSDGSTDRMRARLHDLLRRGLIDGAHATDLRGGKAAACNLAVRAATGDILINVDCDCSFDRHALRNMVAAFESPSVGAVCGNVQVRNPDASLISAFQAIEYLISISLGRQAADVLGQVSCVSGAFGAFRKEALDSVAGLDAGSGEDLDVTLRLRQQGWEIRFAGDAVCYTDVPETLGGLLAQRFRWERDAVRLRYRKHIDLMNPFSPRFRTVELMHELEFLAFNVVAAAALPVYLLWLFSSLGELGVVVLLGAQAGLVMLDAVSFLLAAYATPRTHCLPLLPYLLFYTLFNGVFMRFIRLAAYLQEWVFDASYRDEYVPAKVHGARG